MSLPLPLPGRRPCRLSMVVATCAVLGLATGCADDETPEVDVGPTENPTFGFVRVQNFVPDPEGEFAEPLCLEVPAGDDARIPLLVGTLPMGEYLVDPTKLLLRPPGACGSYIQCGHVALYVDDVLNNESGVPAIDLLLRKLADRYHDGSPLPGSGEPDELTLRVEVQNDYGMTLVDHFFEPLRKEVRVTTQEACP